MQYSYNVDWKSVGSFIRKARESRNLKQKDLAEILSLDDKYLSEIEGGKAAPSLPLLIAISDNLKISVQFLIRGNEEHSEESISKETLFYVPEAKGISDAQHKVVLNTMRELVKNMRANEQ